MERYWTNGRAITAFILAFSALIPFVGVVTGPLSLVFGVVGIRQIRGGDLHQDGEGLAWTGVIIGGLVTVAYLGVAGVTGGLYLLSQL